LTADRKAVAMRVRLACVALLVVTAGCALGASPTETTTAPVTAVPYYAWDNREPGEMRVWIRRD